MLGVAHRTQDRSIFMENNKKQRYLVATSIPVQVQWRREQRENVDGGFIGEASSYWPYIWK